MFRLRLALLLVRFCAKAMTRRRGPLPTTASELVICNCLFVYFCAQINRKCAVSVSISVSKTREVLVDVARQLFARMGFQNTTMNDIAQASQKGRRTLYTYFKSKDDVFDAVVEAELDKLVDSLLEVAARRLPADRKLITYIYMRLHAVKAIVFRNGTLRAAFFRDIWRVEKARKKFDLRETEILRDILNDGVNEGLFSITDIDMTAYIIHHALKGLEVPYIRGHINGWGKSKGIERQNVLNIIFNGIKVKHNVY